LGVEPAFPLLQNVEAVVFAGVGGLFSRDVVACEEAMDRAVAEEEALGGKLAAYLFDGGVPIEAGRPPLPGLPEREPPPRPGSEDRGKATW